MRAAVLETPPHLRRVAPQHQAAAEQLDGRRTRRVQVLDECDRIPLPVPVIRSAGGLLRPRARQVSPSLHLLLSDRAYHCTNDRCPTPSSRSCAVSLATGLDVAACVASPLRAWRAELRLTRARCRGTVQGLCALGNRGAGSGMCWHAPVSHARCPRRDDANDMLFRECLATHEVVLPDWPCSAFGVVPHPCIAQSHNSSEGYFRPTTL